MKTFLNLTSFITLLLIVTAILYGSVTHLILLALWWTVGIHAAISHRKWQDRRHETYCSNKTWIFYTWYSLSGLFLLFSTKVYEVNTEMLWRYTRHHH